MGQDNNILPQKYFLRTCQNELSRKTVLINYIINSSYFCIKEMNFYKYKRNVWMGIYCTDCHIIKEKLFI